MYILLLFLLRPAGATSVQGSSTVTIPEDETVKFDGNEGLKIYASD